MVGNGEGVAGWRSGDVAATVQDFATDEAASRRTFLTMP